MIKKWCVNLGNCVAASLMLSPIYIIMNYQKIDGYLFYLIASIFYDIFMFSFIKKNEYIEHSKEHYFNYIKNTDKKLNLQFSEKQKNESLETFIEDFFDKI